MEDSVQARLQRSCCRVQCRSTDLSDYYNHFTGESDSAGYLHGVNPSDGRRIGSLPGWILGARSYLQETAAWSGCLFVLMPCEQGKGGTVALAPDFPLPAPVAQKIAG